ncbi:F-box protein At3g07870-like [Pyrus x bretschneideri]|uniref:F-box protein At3g07870-like n=1 Tax=Pyrus x bretschneideri TaxID=225117 RepID=UPI00202E1E8B|nr:F-box protein At3g07870-like [Pyrus x bretschneideri]
MAATRRTSLQISSTPTGFSLGNFLKAQLQDPLQLQAVWNFVGLGFSAATNEYKVLQTFYPECESSSPDNLYETEISTIGTGVCRSIENAPWDYVCLSFNVFLHGALHWVSESTRYSQFREKEFADCLKLGVVGDCLFVCVYGDDPRQFDMWVMKEYGVQDSWTKTLVVEKLYLRERSCDLYEPLIFLSNGEILIER